MSVAQRPRLLAVVAGTGTDIGKTWVGCRLAEALADRHRTVTARKPAQSFEDGDTTTDADLLAAATGDEVDDVCPPHRWYPVPMAPPMAADELGRDPIALADLVEEVRGSWPGRAPDVGLVELAGGLRSPIAHDGDGADLVRQLIPDLVIVVADAGLGTVNAVRQAMDDLAELPTVVLLNRFDPSDRLHARNRDWLADIDRYDVVSDIETLVGVVLDGLPAFCVGCGRRAADCPGGCSTASDPARHCPVCGRRLAVTVIPTGVSARCRDHGPVESPPHRGPG